MSAKASLRFAPFWWAAGFLLTAYVVYASLAPSGGHAPWWWPSDKVMHFSAYTAVAFWFTGVVERRRYPLVAIFLLALGAAVEVAQRVMALGRSAELGDFLANSLGIAMALALAYAGLGSWMAFVERRLGLAQTE